jgi:hypothetical protein
MNTLYRPRATEDNAAAETGHRDKRRTGSAQTI